MRKLALACILSIGFMFSGCLGPNYLQNSLNNWNAEVVEQDWLAETIFIPMIFVQVAAWMGDVLVVNTVDYWSGDNWLDDPGPFPGDKFSYKD